MNARGPWCSIQRVGLPSGGGELFETGGEVYLFPEGYIRKRRGGKDPRGADGKRHPRREKLATKEQ